MKKITKFVIGMIAMVALCAGITACSQPTDTPETPETDTTKTSVELLEEAFSTKKWEGQTVAAEKFAGLAAGDEIVVQYDVNDDGEAGYHMFQLQAGDGEGYTTFKEVAGLSSAGTFTYKFTDKDAATITALTTYGFKIQGNSITVKKATLVQYKAAE